VKLCLLYSMSQGSSALHVGSSMPGYDMSVTRAAMMSVSVTEPSKPSLLMLDDLGMSGSASNAPAPAAYSNNANLSKDFINSKVLFANAALICKDVDDKDLLTVIVCLHILIINQSAIGVNTVVKCIQ